MHTSRARGTAAFLVQVSLIALMGVTCILQPLKLTAQKAPRLNRMIEALENGRVAISGDTWTWVEQEHEPFVIDKLAKALNALLGKRNAQGQTTLAPLVRIPMEGDQQSRWAIKQVLELGAMGVIVPMVENAQQALTLVQSMRYPQRTGSKYFEPRGRRGCCISPAALWMLANPSDYFEKADLWPLNPGGELFLLLMVENQEGVDNIQAIISVPGVSGVIIGPADLNANLGNGYGARGPSTEAAIEKVLRTCAAAKKICGMVDGSDAGIKRYSDMGARLFYAASRPGATYSPGKN